MSDVKQYTLFSGGANGAEAEFGLNAERLGMNEVNYTFEGHQMLHSRGIRVLTSEELARKDVSLTYVSRLLNRRFTDAPTMRKVLQTIMYQVESGHEVFVVGEIQPDNTVRGGTGWGAEFAKICNKPLYVFEQAKDAWSLWEEDHWIACKAPVIGHYHFCGTGTRFIEDSGKRAIAELFDRSFSK